MDIVFATHNQHKTEEARAIAGPNWHIRNLHDLSCTEEIPETADTLLGNALQKAQYVADHYQVDCFADDTGLEIEALDGRPGVYSARYAGEHCSFSDNVRKVLAEMQGIENRKACFKTVIPDGYTESFAELPAEVKNSISHRGAAMRKLMDFLKA